MVMSSKYVRTSGTLQAHVLQNEFLSEISPKPKFFVFSVCLVCANHVPDVRTSFELLWCHNTDFCGSNGVFRFKIQQKLAFLAGFFLYRHRGYDRLGRSVEAVDVDHPLAEAWSTSTVVGRRLSPSTNLVQALSTSAIFVCRTVAVDKVGRRTVDVDLIHQKVKIQK